jgi:hypothetical protein
MGGYISPLHKYSCMVCTGVLYLLPGLPYAAFMDYFPNGNSPWCTNWIYIYIYYKSIFYFRGLNCDFCACYVTQSAILCLAVDKFSYCRHSNAFFADKMWSSVGPNLYTRTSSVHNLFLCTVSSVTHASGCQRITCMSEVPLLLSYLLSTNLYWDVSICYLCC